MVSHATYALVALFGFGVGVYDVNAIESKHRPVDNAYRKAAEIVAVSRGYDDIFDPSSVISQLTGEVQAPQLPGSSTFSGMNVTSFLGDIPQTVETLEPIAGAKYVTSTIFDGLGLVKEIDEANNSYARGRG
jgi:hypothetical protein